MNIKKNIEVLLENGFHFNTISKLTKNQIRVLVEKINKEETNEVVQTTPSTGFKTTAQAGDEVPIGDTLVIAKGPVEIMSKDKPGAGLKKEGEVTEKFESKAQQGLFWSKCENSTGKTKEKWCRIAKKFSAETTKKQYKDMPEKKHPEKTVKKTTKKQTNESQEKFLEDSIVEMLEKHINPSMTKSNLVKSINERVKNNNFTLMKPKKLDMFSEEEGKEMKTMKRPIGKMFSLGEDTKEKERTKTREKEKDKDRKNPFQPKHNPAPKAGKGSLPNFLKWDKLGVNLK